MMAGGKPFGNDLFGRETDLIEIERFWNQFIDGFFEGLSGNRFDDSACDMKPELQYEIIISGGIDLWKCQCDLNHVSHNIFAKTEILEVISFSR